MGEEGNVRTLCGFCVYMGKLLITGVEIKEAKPVIERLKKIEVELSIRLESSGDMSDYIDGDGNVDIQKLMDFLAATLPTEL